jgi:hypothetical protein
LVTAFTVRHATVADAPIISRHRAEMFRDMGALPSSLYDPLMASTVCYLEHMMPAGEYVGWLAMPSAMPETVLKIGGL